MIDLTNKKILLVRNDNVGDLICTTPAIEALRKKYPLAQIDIVVNSYNYSAIDQNPFVNKIYCYTKPKHKKTIKDKIKAAFGKLKIIYDINRENYDVVIVLRSDFSKSAQLFSKITNAKYKVGVKNPRGKDDFNIYIAFDKKMNEVDFCYESIKSFGVIKDNENTKFYVPFNLIEKYAQFKNFIAFHISARVLNNQMSYDKLYLILNELKDKNIIITAEPKDYELALKLEKNLNIKFIKTDSFIDLGGLFSNLQLLITLEGGTMHLSPAVGTKTLALFGVSDINRWYPWGYKDLVIQDQSKIANNIDVKIIINKINMVILNEISN